MQMVPTPRGDIPCLSLAHTRANDERAATETIHFSPANGFPVAAYTEFLDLFADRYKVSGSDNRGAWPDEPEPKRQWNWNDHALDLIAAIEALHTSPVIGMGHSIGGTVTVLAAAMRPDLFSKVIIIDAATVPSKLISHFYHLIPKWLSFKLFNFIRGSHQRRRLWPSPEAFFDNYRSHPTYRNFTERALRDYAQAGLVERSDGQYVLRYNPAWESFNFRRVHYLWDALEALEKDALVLRAENTYLYTQAQFDALNEHVGDNVESGTIAACSHLAPLEQPIRVAQQILSWRQLSPTKT